MSEKEALWAGVWVEPAGWAATAIDGAAIVILILGALRFAVKFCASEISADADARASGIDDARIELGRYILAGLEVLIVSDVIHTALSLALEDIAFLGALVVVRSTISFFLDREISQLEARRGAP